MSAASCDKLIRAVCTGDITEIDSGTLTKLSSEDVCKLRALTLEGDNIKFQNDGMWGNLLALNLLLSSDDDEKKVSARCGDRLSIFMLALVCCRVDICRTLLNTFNIPLALRTEKGLSTLDLAPPSIRNDLLKLLDLEQQGTLAYRPAPTYATLQDLGSTTRYASARDLNQNKFSPLPISRISSEPDLTTHSETHNRRGSMEMALAEFSSMVQATRKASISTFNDFSQRVMNRRGTVDSRSEAPPPPPNRRATVTSDYNEVSYSSYSSEPMTRSQIDALNASSSYELLRRGLRDLETYVSAERTRLAKEQKIKSTEMIAESLKYTEAGLEAQYAVAEARGVPVPNRRSPNQTRHRSLKQRPA